MAGKHRRSAQRRFVRTLVALDVLLIAGVMLVALLIDWGFRPLTAADIPRFTIVAAFLIIWPTMLWQQQTRTDTILGGGIEEYRRVVVASLWTVCLVATGLYLTNTTRGRAFFVVVSVVGMIALVLGRMLMRHALLWRLAKGSSLHKVYVVADTSALASIRDEFAASRGLFGTVGFWDLTKAEPEPEVVVRKALKVNADAIVYSPGTHQDPSWPRRLGWAMENTDLSLLVSPALVEIAGPRLSVEPVQGLVMVRVEMPTFAGPTRFVKRLIDLVVSGLLLLVLGVPLLIIGFLVRRDSPGPALFKQDRAGTDGERFTCWKFRTMVQDADAQRQELRAQQGDEGATFKLADDARVTSIGKFLRRFSIDELPQLVNVFRGDMGLVGPRPHPFDDVERYDDLATRRLLVKPGMTGLWQVSGRSDLDWDKSVMLDLYYVENWSLALDLIILGRTVGAVLKGSGSY
ncbi:MAG: sugar transferase [Actinomycetes bacterium]